MLTAAMSRALTRPDRRARTPASLNTIARLVNRANEHTQDYYHQARRRRQPLTDTEGRDAAALGAKLLVLATVFICTPWADSKAENRFFDILESNPDIPLYSNCQRLVRLMERDLARIARDSEGPLEAEVVPRPLPYT